MIVLLSPAKTLDYETPPNTSIQTEPRFMDNSAELIKELKKLSAPQVASLMKLSDKLGELNHHRFQTWRKKPAEKNIRQALLAFKGDVYVGLQAETFKVSDFKFAQKNLRILSGLYGLLRPLDTIQAYRLEMGTKFQTNTAKDLYGFWGDSLTEQLNQDIKSSRAEAVINLASVEYAKVIKPKLLDKPIISPVFKEEKNGQLKIISFFAKKARGTMAAYIIKNRLNAPEDILTFDEDGYRYEKSLSSEKAPVFVR